MINIRKTEKFKTVRYIDRGAYMQTSSCLRQSTDEKITVTTWVFSVIKTVWFDDGLCEQIMYNMFLKL